MNAPLRLQDNCATCPIHHTALCAHQNGPDLQKLGIKKRYVTYKAGDPIQWRGDTLTHISSVVSGVASLSRTMEDGRVQVVGLLMPSDIIGRPDRGEVEFDVTAITDIKLCQFNKTDFEDLILDMPRMSHRMMEMALDELNLAREWMVLLGRKKAHERLASFLLLIMRRGRTDRPWDQTHTLPLSREQMANFLGLTLETISRQLSKLRRSGVVTFVSQRQFVVEDEAALLHQSGDEGDILCVA